MVSVIKTGGQQYVVTVGKKLEVDKIKAKAGSSVEFADLLNKNNTVKAKILNDKKGKKVGVLKFKNKSRYLRQGSHRQSYTIIEITDITSVKSKPKTSKKKPNESKTKSS